MPHTPSVFSDSPDSHSPDSQSIKPFVPGDDLQPLLRDYAALVARFNGSVVGTENARELVQLATRLALVNMSDTRVLGEETAFKAAGKLLDPKAQDSKAAFLAAVERAKEERLQDLARGVRETLAA